MVYDLRIFLNLNMWGNRIMKNIKKSQIINICWRPMFAALMTGILSKSTDFDAIVIGLVLGTAASIACYFEVKKLLPEKQHK